MNQQAIAEYLRSCFAARTTKLLTVGIELEFFLYRGGQIVGHAESQNFFDSLASLCDGIRGRKIDGGIGAHLAQVEFKIREHQIRLKYDHHPHLLELEFAPTSDLNEFEFVIFETWDLIFDCANHCNLKADFSPFLDSSVPDDLVWSNHSLCCLLRDYRIGVNSENDDVLEQKSLINFSAYVAATQVHVGGIGLDHLEYCLNLLYRIEPVALNAAWSMVAKEHRKPSTRFQGYSQCLGRLPLVTFPKLNNWSFEEWSIAMLQMPIANTLNNQEFARVCLTRPESVFAGKRDLSIIKPREYGTIEFRGDPCVPDPRSAMTLLAFRLGICQQVARSVVGEFALDDYNTARGEWLNLIDSNSLGQWRNAAVFAADGLKTRGLGEEALLANYT